MLLRRKYRRDLLMLCLLCLGMPSIAADAHKFVNYSNHNGLNQNTISALEQDKQGNLWIGTPNGLIKYDGYDFRDYSWNPKSIHGLSNNQINDIHSDRSGLLWILNANGVQILDPETERFYDIPLNPEVRITRFVDRNDSTLWLLGQDFLATISIRQFKDSINQQLSPNLIREDMRPLLLRDLLQTNQEKMLLATDQGVYLVRISEDPGGNLSLAYLGQTGLPDQSVTRIISSDETIWIGSDDGLHKAFLESDNLHIIQSFHHDPGNPNSLQADFINELLVSKNGNLWIGTYYGGLSVYPGEGESFTNYPFNPQVEGSLTSSMVNCLYEDDFDIIWVGTAQGGLCKLDPHQKEFINFQHNPFDENTLSGNLIGSIMEDSKGYLWVISYRDPLCRSRWPVGDRDLSKLEFQRFDGWFRSHPDKVALSVKEDDQGIFWIGYEFSMAAYNPSLSRFREVKFVNDGETVPMYSVHFIEPAGADQMIIGNNPLILAEKPRWDKGNGGEILTNVFDQFEIPGNTAAISMLMDCKGQLWVGTRHNGLYLFSLEENKFKLLKVFQSGNNNSNSNLQNGVFSLYEGNDGQIWVGSFGGGLYRLVGENVESYELEYVSGIEELENDAIYGILPDQRENLWISTDMGLCRMDLSNGDCVNYNVNDGLLNNNFRQKAYHAGASGYFYFGGLNGLTCFRPEDIRSNQIPPKVQIIGLEINNDPVKKGEQINRRFTMDRPIGESSRIVLHPKNRSVSFEFLIRHNASPQNNTMSYRLHGFDREWRNVASGKFIATYMNLPAGEYGLEINGYNGDGLMSEASHTLEITVLKPWIWRWWSLLMMVILAFLIIGGIFMYLFQLERLKQSLGFEQKDKERIAEVNQAKLKFFTNISHEFRTLLTLISAPLQILMETTREGEQRKYLGLMDKNTKKLGFLIDQLLTFRKIEQEKMDLKLVKTTLGDLIYPIGEAFELYALKTNLLFDYTASGSEKSIILDYEKMEMVIFNLLSNAFKFTPSKGMVRLECKIVQTARGETVRITVSDTGIGIPADKVEHIFDRFYQVDSELSGAGTGIGLSYSKSIAELHQGTIRVTSRPGIETFFTVDFPLVSGEAMDISNVDASGSRTRDLLAHEELKTSLNSSGDLIQDDGKPCILVVDDKIVLCNLLRDILDTKYKVLDAADGKEGLDKVMKHEPDLVISDVMMPVMNGFELCQKIKADMELCHIPVILVTALGKEKQITGAEHGADEYITKPFDVNYLVVKIEQLIQNRKRVQDHFSKFQSLPESLSLSVTDKDFMQKVNEAIGKNLDNSSFGVEELARELGFSSSLVYRKLKQFTGQIPSGYLRNYRLQAAASRIRKDPYVSLKMVRYEVGFASASHFTHAFKEKFGDTPSEYAKKVI